MLSRRQRILARYAEVLTTFRTWEPELRELERHLAPGRCRWDSSRAFQGGEADSAIINGSPLISVRVLSSGMMAGITSPARRWFKLTTPDPQIAEQGSVRGWLHLVEERIRWAFSRSNIYTTLADGTYTDLGVFGFHCTIVEEDAESILRFITLPVGEYQLDTNARGEVDTLFRTLPMTVRQVVEEFGLENCSRSVQQAYASANLATVVEVVHAILPNDELQAGRLGPKGKRYASLWWEKNSTEEKWLREGGYEEFPAICPRWEVKGSDAYGKGPGSKVLGDCRVLQHDEVRRAELIDKLVDPPMNAPEAMRGQRLSLIPGDVNYTPNSQQGQGFQPAMTVQPGALQYVEAGIERMEDAIGRGLYADLWQRVIADDRAQRATAREVEEGHQETMLQLGPVLERLNAELLRRLITRTYAILLRGGAIPFPPEEVQGMDLRVEFQSILHQAQIAVGLGGLRSFILEVGQLSAIKPEALDKLNADELVDELAAMTGIKPDLVNTDEEVEAIRAARAQKQQAADQGAAMVEAAKAGATLASAPAPSTDNMLGSILADLGPLAQGGPGLGGGMAQ